MNYLEEQRFNEMMGKIHNQVGSYHNFDSTMKNYGGSNPIMEKMLFDSAMNTANYDPSAKVLNMNESLSLEAQMAIAKSGKAVKGLSTYALKMVYTAGAGSLPVTVTLFAPDFGEGVVVGDTVVFSNATGDQVVVSGRTAAYTRFLKRLVNSPANIRFGRMTPQDAGQFLNEISFRKETVYGGTESNRLLPDIYFTPDQFQSLRVDIPMNFSIDSEKGLTFDVDNTEVGAGLGFIFWMDEVINETRKLDHQPSVVNMGANGLVGNSPSISTNQLMSEFIAAKRLQIGK